jgi:hypothetical protein
MTSDKTSRRVARGLALVAIAALLTSCGGTELVAFVPARVLSFGDESSVMTAEGKKYTINAVVPESGVPGTIDCVRNPIWNQVLATSFGITFPQCPGSVEGVTPTGRIAAQAGATAGGARDIDLAGQITRQLETPAADGGGINSKDLVSLLIGVNDVVSLYERYERKEITGAEATALAEQAGETVAAQISRITDAGGRVIIATVPDVGVTPYARDKGVDARAVLSALTARMNARLLVTIDNDGRKTGLIELNPYLVAVVTNPGVYKYVNVSEAACLTAYPLPNCTANTLKAAGPDEDATTAFNWLWANSLQFSAGAHQQLGNLASTRAHNQPF